MASTAPSLTSAVTRPSLVGGSRDGSGNLTRSDGGRRDDLGANGPPGRAQIRHRAPANPTLLHQWRSAARPSLSGRRVSTPVSTRCFTAPVCEWTSPSAIRFGRDGQLFYVAGPHDNVARVVATMSRPHDAMSRLYVPVPAGQGRSRNAKCVWGSANMRSRHGSTRELLAG